MSYTMSSTPKACPTAADIMEALGPSAVRCVEFGDQAPEGDWPERVLHLHRLERSARGVEVRFERSRLRVRMVSLANREDWELAFRILEAFAVNPSDSVEGEDGTACSLTEVRACFLDVLLRESAATFLSMKGALSGNPDLLIELRGPVRSVFLGPRCFRELPSDSGQAIAALMERIRRVQYLEAEGFEVRSPMSLPGSVGVRLTLWDPRKAQAFEPTDNVGLRAPSGSLTVPVAQLVALVGERFVWLDEKQFALHATPEAELSELYEWAASMTVDPYVATADRKWWQFWR